MSKKQFRDFFIKDEASSSNAKKTKVDSTGGSSQSVIDKYGLVWNQNGKDLFPGTKEVAYLHAGPNSSLQGRNKIAGFDIDYTIIGTKSGKVFAVDKNDWKILFDCIPKKLEELNEAGYRIVFFTNQAGIEKRKQSLEDMQSKFSAIINKLGIPIYVILATGNNYYRKPSTEMWNFVAESCNDGIKVDLIESFYVGDAAGRPKDWAPKKRKDFSCSDRMFAANIGIKFFTPEEYFFKYKPQQFEWRSVDPRSLLEATNGDSPKTYHSMNQEMIIMVGMQGSGKSTFCKQFLQPHGYVVVNRDTLGTQVKCIKHAEESLISGKSVVIDNTNPAVKDRAFYMDAAKKKGIPVRCFLIGTSEKVAHHLNLVRQNLNRGKSKTVPPVAYNIYKGNLVKPTKSEGFCEVIEIPFIPTFESEEHKRLFLQWTD